MLPGTHVKRDSHSVAALSVPAWKVLRILISRLLRRPLLVVALLLAVVGLSGAGYAVTGGDRSSELAPQRAAAAADEAAADDKADRKAAQRTAQRERAAKLEAERAAAEKAAAEAAQKAAAKAAQEKQEAARKQQEAARKQQEAARKQQEAARQAAEAKRVAEAKKAEQARQGSAARASRDAARDPRGVARLMLGQYGWGADQFTCLDRLWTKESGWKPTADNPTSSAYGIPQALPGSKMASAGSDWRTNPVTQIRWGLQYIKSTYGTPCSAWGQSQANNWY